MRRSTKRHLVAAALIAPSITLSTLLSAEPAFASASCSTRSFYEPAQFSINHDFSGIQGYLTNPTASYLPGDQSNHQYYDHMLLIGQIHDQAPSGDFCGGGTLSSGTCWIQGGVGMGTVTNGNVEAHNYTNLYEVYWENSAVQNTYQVAFLPAILVNQGAALKFEIMYDGHNGNLGHPQYTVHVGDGNGNYFYVGSGELYSSTGHADAGTEVYVGSNATCPVLTNGSPWQNFGTDANGNRQVSNEIQLQSGGNWAIWSGSPNINTGQDPYFFTKLNDWPGAFRTNGPANGPA